MEFVVGLVEELAVNFGIFIFVFTSKNDCEKVRTSFNNSGNLRASINGAKREDQNQG